MKGVVNALDGTSNTFFTRSIARPRGGNLLPYAAPNELRASFRRSNVPTPVSTTTPNQRLEVSIRGSEKESQKEQQEEEITSSKLTGWKLGAVRAGSPPWFAFPSAALLPDG
jgi:hypothetical protein